MHASVWDGPKGAVYEICKVGVFYPKNVFHNRILQGYV